MIPAENTAGRPLMNHSVFLPNEFGTSWQDFLHNWCLDVEPRYSQADVIRALAGLKQIHPECVTSLATGTARGILVIAPAIDLGGLLADCEDVHGFASVAERLKRGERSAYSELVIVSYLMRLGYSPSFVAPLNRKNLDAMCVVEQQTVYFEVVTPEQSIIDIEARKVTDDLSRSIRQSVPDCHIEVEFLAVPSADNTQQIVEVAKDLPADKWITIGSIARIQKIPSKKGGTTFRWEPNDTRAKRIFNDEYHHFSEQTANVLVVNVSAVIDGLPDWISQFERLLQPSQNRKVGAVVLFDQHTVGSLGAICRRWKIIVNPYAHVAVPKSLIEGFWSFDESWRYPAGLRLL